MSSAVKQHIVLLLCLLASTIKPSGGSFIGGLFQQVSSLVTPTPSTPPNFPPIPLRAEEKRFRIPPRLQQKLPPVNPTYAAQLKFLSTLPLKQRIEYVKAGLLRTGANALQSQGNFFNRQSQNLYNAAQDLQGLQRPSPPPIPPRQPPQQQNNNFNGIQARDPFSSNLSPGIVDDVELLQLQDIDPALNDPSAPLTFGKLQQIIARQRLMSQQQRLRQINRGPAQVSTSRPVQVLGQQQFSNQQQFAAPPTPNTCTERMGQLVGDIFIGHEMIPQVIDLPPDYPLELTYRTVRTFPGMRLTAEATRFKPMIHWPAEQGVLYTVVMSNLDINSRRNRTLSEFWHWFVANVPGNNIDDGTEIFQLLHPLVLPEGSGDHRFGFFVLKQPSFLDYSQEGGPTDNCSPLMSAGRGPYRSTKEFIKKYGLRLVAATFLIIDTSTASVEIACEWQQCMGGEVFLADLDCTVTPPRLRRKK